MSEYSVYFRPAELPGVEALHARFVEHSYAPHSHPTWTVAVVHHGAASFDVDATHQRADRGELFVLEPEAVHTGMAAVPEGWAYEVLYLDPALLHEWDEGDAALPRAARWVVFRDRALRESLVRMHAVLRAEPVVSSSTSPCWAQSRPYGHTCGLVHRRFAAAPSTWPCGGPASTWSSVGINPCRSLRWRHSRG